jgi:hypothetical protein
MKNGLGIIGLILIITIIFSCTNTTEPNEEQKIVGLITNSENAPIENAKIMLSYYTESINFRPTTTIAFNIPNTSNVDVWISHHNDIDIVKVLYDDILEAGNHILTWDTTNDQNIFVVNNIYDCHIQAEGYSRIIVLPFLHNYYTATGNDVENYESLDTSNENGEFSIDYENLPLFSNDYTFELYDNEGVVVDTLKILNYVKIWALHQDFQPTFVDSVLLNENATTEASLKFQ